MNIKLGSENEFDEAYLFMIKMNWQKWYQGIKEIRLGITPFKRTWSFLKLGDNIRELFSNDADGCHKNFENNFLIEKIGLDIVGSWIFFSR